MVEVPPTFSFFSQGELRSYHATRQAIELYGHEEIIQCIELAREHETGAIRHYNADAFPVSGIPQQLLVLRSQDNSIVLALADEELPELKSLFDKLFDGH